ncbi:MAG: hypothetical protein WDO74_12230 [Pseudomonadota bacterium]
MTETKVHQGVKISPEEAKTLDRSKVAVGIVQMPEVEGQQLYVDIVACPWCGTYLRVLLSTDVYMAVTCGNCGQHFRR